MLQHTSWLWLGLSENPNTKSFFIISLSQHKQIHERAQWESPTKKPEPMSRGPFLDIYIYDMYLIGAIRKLLIKISNGHCVPVMNYYYYIYIFSGFI